MLYHRCGYASSTPPTLKSPNLHHPRVFPVGSTLDGLRMARAGGYTALSPSAFLQNPSLTPLPSEPRPKAQGLIPSKPLQDSNPQGPSHQRACTLKLQGPSRTPVAKQGSREVRIPEIRNSLKDRGSHKYQIPSILTFLACIPTCFALPCLGNNPSLSTLLHVRSARP